MALDPCVVGRAAEPTGVPQWWQKRAPGVRELPQVRHVAPSSGVPQLEQKRPSAAAPQAGQVRVVTGMGRIYWKRAGCAQGNGVLRVLSVLRGSWTIP
jgi:hypothetical protein